MDVWKGIGVAVVVLACGRVNGQAVETVVRTPENADEFGFKPTDTGISVGEHAIVITSNHGIMMYDKAGNELDLRRIDGVAPSQFPFIRWETDVLPPDPPPPLPPRVAVSRWFDPRSEYDAVHNRQWMIYVETNDDPQTTQDGDISPIHLAISKDPSDFPPLHPAFDTFDDTHWWYYTGRAQAGLGNAGAAFNMADGGIDPYPGGSPHNPFPAQTLPGVTAALVDLPTMAIDERAVYLTAYGTDNDGTSTFDFQAIFILPITFDGGASSMLDGDRPDEGDDLLVLRPRDLPPDPPEPAPPVVEYEPDPYIRQYAVQEPFLYEEVENAQLFISISDDASLKQDRIRVAGLWFDDTDPDPLEHRWRYTQHIENDAQKGYPLLDVAVGPSLEFYYGSSYQAATPASDFNPRTPGAFISSAVLAKDSQGELRLFVAHYARPAGQSGPDNGVVVQWYVIDPDLDNFRVIQNPPVWNPQIVQGGRIDSDGTNSGDCYYPSIGVTRQGEAYIEYTFSNSQTWPQVRRIKLNSSYSAPVTNVLVEPGPVNRTYEDDPTGSDLNDAWADFSDMQHDPVLCKLWSVHTLVHDPGGTPPGSVVEGDKRDIWLFENRYTPVCFSPDLNQNMIVDPGDALLFNDFYANEDPRADADADGDVNAIDAAIFLDRYTAGTP